MLDALPGDLILHIICHHFTWNEYFHIACACKSVHSTMRSTLRACEGEQRLLKERVLMTTNDERRCHDYTYNYTLSTALEWKKMFLDNSRWFRQRRVILKPGALVDACDFQKSWCPAQILSWRTTTVVHKPLAPGFSICEKNRRYWSAATARVDTVLLLRVRFLGWSNVWNEDVTPRRIRALGAATVTPEGDYSNQRQWLLYKSPTRGKYVFYLHRSVGMPRDPLPITDVTVSLLVEGRQLYGFT